VVNKDCTRTHGAQRSLLTEDNFAHVIVIADTREYDVSAARGCSGRCGSLAGIFVSPRLRLAAGAIEDGHLVPCPGKIPGHGIAHNTKPDKRCSHDYSRRRLDIAPAPGEYQQPVLAASCGRFVNQKASEESEK
jgi:hypothetical protein